MKQFASFIATLWVLLTLTFVLIRIIPGDPFADEKSLPEEIQAGLRRQYGLDKPWYNQYYCYLKSVVTWDFGPSFKYKDRTVNQIINEGFPISLILGLESLTLAIALGVVLGTFSALKKTKWQDHMLAILITLGVSIPSFMIATLLQYILGVKLGIFPVARWGTFMQSVLPAISLAAYPTAIVAKFVRTNMIEVLDKKYITAARARGIPENRVVYFHGLKNGLLPILPYLGQLCANILVGSFVIEKIFGIPGLGRWFVVSVINRDYSVIMGVTIFYGVILLSCVWFCDALYKRLDPRIMRK